MGVDEPTAHTVERTGAGEKEGVRGKAMGPFTSRSLYLFRDVFDGWASGAHDGGDVLLGVPLDEAVSAFVRTHGFTTLADRAWARLFVMAYRRAATLGMAMETAMREADRSDERRRELLELGALLRDAELSAQEGYAALFGDPHRFREPRDDLGTLGNNCRQAKEIVAARAQLQEE